MRRFSKIRFPLVIVSLLGFGISGSAAQGPASSRPPPPDPTHIPFFPTPLTLPSNIPWKGDPARGEQGYSLIAGSGKTGLYAGLTKWLPGHHSHPHFHNQTRYIYVVSGTWWVSSSNKEDISTMYPMHAGSFVTDVANTVHWDGAKAGDEPAVILLFGMGPVVTTYVDEQGKPLPSTGSSAGTSAQPPR
jgi:quercetin dioxygenase-like cupin family protein